MQAISTDIQKPAYIALGLSDDDKMGGDSVIECVPENNRINAYTSYTTAPTPFASGRDGIPQNFIRLVDSSFVDGTIRCQIERQTISDVRGRRFDLANDQYYLLLALGESLKETENSVGYHSIGRISTPEKIRLPVNQKKYLNNLLHSYKFNRIFIFLARYLFWMWYQQNVCRFS